MDTLIDYLLGAVFAVFVGALLSLTYIYRTGGF
jgi:hypothetical protein